MGKIIGIDLKVGKGWVSAFVLGALKHVMIVASEYEGSMTKLVRQQLGVCSIRVPGLGENQL